VWLLPPETTWPKVGIESTANEHMIVTVQKQSRGFGPSDLGLVDRRNGKPSTAWRLLLLLAERGRLRAVRIADQAKVRKQVEDLNRRLSTALGVAGNAIVSEGSPKAYRPFCVLRDARPRAQRENSRWESASGEEFS
jgi:hypothetical protein